jgi:oligopeptide/dipeptide ABC transporter ATP-binding protein
LLNAVPRLDPVVERERQVPVLAGEVPSPLDPPRGCRFCTRCPLVEERCRQNEPPMRKIADGHEFACWVV